MRREFRLNERDEVEVYGHRAKLWILFVGLLLLTGGGLLLVVTAPGEGMAWVALLFFGLLTLVLVRRYVLTGVLFGSPALVLGPQGIRYRVRGKELSWEDVASVSEKQQTVRGITHRHVFFRYADREKWRAENGPLARLGARLSSSSYALRIHASSLATTPGELGAIVRRYYDDPVSITRSGIELDEQGLPRRTESRGDRFRGTVRNWAIGFALALPVVAVYVVLD